MFYLITSVMLVVHINAHCRHVVVDGRRLINLNFCTFINSLLLLLIFVICSMRARASIQFYREPLSQWNSISKHRAAQTSIAFTQCTLCQHHHHFQPCLILLSCSNGTLVNLFRVTSVAQYSTFQIVGVFITRLRFTILPFYENAFVPDVVVGGGHPRPLKTAWRLCFVFFLSGVVHHL